MFGAPTTFPDTVSTEGISFRLFLEVLRLVRAALRDLKVVAGTGFPERTATNISLNTPQMWLEMFMLVLRRLRDARKGSQ